jgi:flagellar motor protein MotB
VRPDTVGKIEEVEAKVELLPRGLYSWHVPDQFDSSRAAAPKVSMHEYEALSELYQAQNAIGIARAAGAERYATETFAKAQQLLAQAQQIEAGKKDTARVVETAREAAQTAEDARVIASKHQQDDAIAKARAEAAQAQKATVAAEQNALSARADAEAAKAEAEAERIARQRAEQRAAEAEARVTAPVAAPQTAVQVPAPVPVPDDSARKTALRVKMMEQLNQCAPTRDTPRGLVITTSGFNSSQLERIANVLTVYPGLRIEVEGHTDTPDSVTVSQQRAEGVREALIHRGVPSSMIFARGLGNSHPLTSNRTAAGREENQRIEIIVSGDAIGNLPSWDRTYPLTSRQ